MKTILKEFYVNDQWFIQNHEYRRRADTSLVYEPVLNRYGYTTDDYLYSLEHYLSDPDKFAKLIKSGSAELSAEVTRLHELQDDLRAEEDRRRHEPWTPFDFERADYLKLPVIPEGPPAPFLNPSYRPSMTVYHSNPIHKYEPKDPHELPVPFRRH